MRRPAALRQGDLRCIPPELMFRQAKSCMLTSLGSENVSHTVGTAVSIKTSHPRMHQHTRCTTGTHCCGSSSICLSLPAHCSLSSACRYMSPLPPNLAQNASREWLCRRPSSSPRLLHAASVENASINPQRLRFSPARPRSAKRQAKVA